MSNSTRARTEADDSVQQSCILEHEVARNDATWKTTRGVLHNSSRACQPRQKGQREVMRRVGIHAILPGRTPSAWPIPPRPVGFDAAGKRRSLTRLPRQPGRPALLHLRLRNPRSPPPRRSLCLAAARGEAPVEDAGWKNGARRRRAAAGRAPSAGRAAPRPAAVPPCLCMFGVLDQTEELLLLVTLLPSRSMGMSDLPAAPPRRC